MVPTGRCCPPSLGKETKKSVRAVQCAECSHWSLNRSLAGRLRVHARTWPAPAAGARSCGAAQSVGPRRAAPPRRPRRQRRCSIRQHTRARPRARPPARRARASPTGTARRPPASWPRSRRSPHPGAACSAGQVRRSRRRRRPHWMHIVARASGADAGAPGAVCLAWRRPRRERCSGTGSGKAVQTSARAWLQLASSKWSATVQRSPAHWDPTCPAARRAAARAPRRRPQPSGPLPARARRCCQPAAAPAPARPTRVARVRSQPGCGCGAASQRRRASAFRRGARTRGLSTGVQLTSVPARYAAACGCLTTRRCAAGGQAPPALDSAGCAGAPALAPQRTCAVQAGAQTQGWVLCPRADAARIAAGDAKGAGTLAQRPSQLPCVHVSTLLCGRDEHLCTAKIDQHRHA